jgi:hypothetical protein
MKKCVIVLFLVFSFVLASIAGLSARPRQGSDPFLLPQMGLWVGAASPVYTTYDDVNSSLAGGAFARINLWTLPLKLGIDGSFEKHSSLSVKGIELMPVYGSLIYRLPIDALLSFQLKAGAGGSYIRVLPAGYSQWDPLFTVGGEFSFPAGSLANIGLRIDYLLLWEQHIKDAKRNGHFINAGVTLYFNLDLFD